MAHLTVLSAREGAASEQLEQQPARDTDFRDEQLGAMPVMRSLVLNFRPRPGWEGRLRLVIRLW